MQLLIVAGVVLVPTGVGAAGHRSSLGRRCKMEVMTKPFDRGAATRNAEPILGSEDRGYEGVSLRAMRADDWEAIHSFGKLAVVYRYQSWEPNTADQTRAYVADAAAAYDKKAQELFYRSAVRSDGHIVGMAHIRIRSRQWRCAEIGYTVHPKYWHRGYGTQIAAHAIEFAFSDLGMHRVEATCDPRNVWSTRILEKVGMTHEGTMRHTMELRDGWRDSHMFSILDEEWPQRH
jgi:[ribosomal protein S5]-alanine N-acetyltransferase